MSKGTRTLRRVALVVGFLLMSYRATNALGLFVGVFLIGFGLGLMVTEEVIG